MRLENNKIVIENKHEAFVFQQMISYHLKRTLIPDEQDEKAFMQLHEELEKLWEENNEIKNI